MTSLKDSMVKTGKEESKVMLEEKKITKVLSENGDDIVGEVVTEKYSNGRVAHTYHHLESNHNRTLANDDWADALFVRGKNIEGSKCLQYLGEALRRKEGEL